MAVEHQRDRVPASIIPLPVQVRLASQTAGDQRPAAIPGRPGCPDGRRIRQIMLAQIIEPGHGLCQTLRRLVPVRRRTLGRRRRTLQRRIQILVMLVIGRHERPQAVRIPAPARHLCQRLGQGGRRGANCRRRLRRVLRRLPHRADFRHQRRQVRRRLQRLRRVPLPIGQGLRPLLRLLPGRVCLAG